MAVLQRSIVFTKPQMEWLKTRSKQLGITVAELVRRVIDEKRDER